MNISKCHPDKVLLGFKAFDLHELLLHFIAARLNLYQPVNLQVELRDITFTPEEKLPHNLFSVACGAALTAEMTGTARRITLVGVDRPLFWLFAQPEISTLSDLVGRRIATYPPAAPPALFLRMRLRQHGFEPDRDFQLEPTRDDVCRLGMLRLKETAAALISSAIPPAAMREAGFTQLLFLGDHIRLPTTGLAVRPELIHQDSSLVSRMVQAHQESVRTFHQDSDAVIEILSDLLGQTAAHGRHFYEAVKPNFTQTGQGRPEDYQPSLERLAQELNLIGDIDITKILHLSFLRQ